MSLSTAATVEVPETTAVFRSRSGQRFTIRACESFTELDQCIALQQAVWGYPDLEVVPRNVFVLAQTLGGHVLGAWDDRGVLAGFAMAVAAHEHTQAYLHSHMLAVAPQYRNQGLGVALKLAQRDEALAHGITRMRWTFDPLMAKNAFLNLRRVRVAAVQYRAKFYGDIGYLLQGGLPTDRLVAEWNLLCARELGSVETELPRIEETIALAAEIDHWRANGSTRELEAAQASLRLRFQDAFAHGLRVVDFEPGAGGGGEYRLAGSSEH